MKLEPLFDRIVFKELIEEEEVSEGGVILAPAYNMEEQELSKGVVVSVGPGRVVDKELVPMTVKVGDTIVYNEEAASSLTINGEQFLIMEEFLVLALLK